MINTFSHLEVTHLKVAAHGFNCIVFYYPFLWGSYAEDRRAATLLQTRIYFVTVFFVAAKRIQLSKRTTPESQSWSLVDTVWPRIYTFHLAQLVFWGIPRKLYSIREYETEFFQDYCSKRGGPGCEERVSWNVLSIFNHKRQPYQARRWPSQSTKKGSIKHIRLVRLGVERKHYSLLKKGTGGEGGRNIKHT